MTNNNKTNTWHLGNHHISMFFCSLIYSLRKTQINLNKLKKKKIKMEKDIITLFFKNKILLLIPYF